jgi:hypothetical protein
MIPASVMAGSRSGLREDELAQPAGIPHLFQVNLRGRLWLGTDRSQAAASTRRSLTRTGLAVFSWKAAELGDLQAEGLEFD